MMLKKKEETPILYQEYKKEKLRLLEEEIEEVEEEEIEEETGNRVAIYIILGVAAVLLAAVLVIGANDSIRMAIFGTKYNTDALHTNNQGKETISLASVGSGSEKAKIRTDVIGSSTTVSKSNDSSMDNASTQLETTNDSVDENELSEDMQLENGDDGQNGLNGKNGELGTTGKPGKPGLPGSDGKNGKNGLNGMDGRDGEAGQDGLDGKSGTDGLDGQDGKNGQDGLSGEDGVNGKDGISGKDGINGSDGVNGKDGESGKSAFQIAQEGGYTGTEEEFTRLMGSFYDDVAKLNTDVAKNSGDIFNVNENLNTKTASLESGINGLGTSITNLGDRVDDCFQSVSDGKKLLADAITDKGVSASATEDFANLAGKVRMITSNSMAGSIKYTYHSHVAGCDTRCSGTVRKYDTRWHSEHKYYIYDYRCSQCSFDTEHHRTEPGDYQCEVVSKTCGKTESTIEKAEITFD